MGVKNQADKRQERLAKERFVCCGMPKTYGHHLACSFRPEDPPLPEQQESLL